MAALSNSKELSGSGSSGSNSSHKSHRPIEMEDEPPSISTLGYKDSYDEMMSTYVLSNGVKINEHGPRDADDHDLELAKGTVHPEDLLVLEELGRGASAVVKRCISRSAASGGGPSESTLSSASICMMLISGRCFERNFCSSCQWTVPL